MKYVALWVHSIARWIGITKNSKSASKAFAKLLSEKAFWVGMPPPKLRNGFPLSRAAFRPLNSTSEYLYCCSAFQLSTTFTDDSGNSWPKQRW